MTAQIKMKFVYYNICFVAMMSLFSCNKTNTGSENSKAIDSLNCSINAISEELKKTDTILLQRALVKFSQYKQFIKQNINDTISKMEADNLQHFYNGGNNLQAFQNNRITLLSRVNLLCSQLGKLANDEKNNALSKEQLSIYLAQETREVIKLSQLNLAQRQLYYAGMEEFKNSIVALEILIKKWNYGELPTIIKDTISF